MARKVFFSFHYEKDIWRASQVRNSWVTKPDRETAGFWDSATWEQVQRQGDEAIKKWINDQLNGTSVTVVLIGSETASRQWVTYEIQKSYERGNGMLGIHIHNIKNNYGQSDFQGKNPFDNLYITTQLGQHTYLSSLYQTYDWVYNDGYHNLGLWVENAVKNVDK